jgi:DNA-binding beta-propeller fold protein YncE
MLHTTTRLLLLSGIVMATYAATTLSLACAQSGDRVANVSLKPARNFPLANVGGRIDHLAIDREGGRLFVAALGNGSIEVIDLSLANSAGRITEMKEPQGIVYLPAQKQVVFTCGGDGAARVIDASTLKELAKVQVGNDADNIRVDAKTGLIYVGFDPGLAVLELNSNTLKKSGEIKLAGHAESFQLEQNGSRIFVNVPDAKQIQVVDREKRAVVANWDVTEARDNYPMALDEKHHRLFVVCRNPAKLLVIDTETGKSVQVLDCVGDADDVFVDSGSQRVYVSGGEGLIDVFGLKATEGGTDQWNRMERVKTASGARTSLLDPVSHTLYLAVPHRGEQLAEIRSFTIERTQQ